MTGRVWHFGQFSAWVIEVAGTPWFVRFPKKGEADRRIVRHILHRTPSWEPEPEGVARLVRHLAGCEGAGRPTTRELTNIGADVVAMAQLLREYDDQLTQDPYFTSMKPIGWWRPGAVPLAEKPRRAKWGESAALRQDVEVVRA
jgi:hypothetical protein